ncbi:MAG: hypothetical protein R2734_01265 [Nocardioides sp.]
MRQLVVGFAFDELGADSCGSGYLAGNHASAAVSRKVGYVDNGRQSGSSSTPGAEDRGGRAAGGGHARDVRSPSR